MESCGGRFTKHGGRDTCKAADPTSHHPSTDCASAPSSASPAPPTLGLWTVRSGGVRTKVPCVFSSSTTQPGAFGCVLMNDVGVSVVIGQDVILCTARFHNEQLHKNAQTRLKLVCSDLKRRRSTFPLKFTHHTASQPHLA